MATWTPIGWSPRDSLLMQGPCHFALSAPAVPWVLPGCVSDVVRTVETTLVGAAHRAATRASGPTAQHPAHRIQSRSARRARDRPGSADAVRVLRRVRRLLCDPPAGPRR